MRETISGYEDGTHILMSAYRRSLADDVRCTRRRVEFPGEEFEIRAVD